MVSRLALVACAVACGARPVAPKPAPTGDDIALYRDGAVIRQRIELDVPATQATVPVTVAAGVAPEQVLVLDRGELTIHAVHVQTVADPPSAAEEIASAATDRPTELRLDVKAPHAGKYAIALGYITNRLTWNVAYTMTTTPARDRGLLAGALAIDNAAGIAFRAASVRLVDAELGVWRGKAAEQLAAALVGGGQASTAPAAPRELGPLAIRVGETRVALMAPSPRRMSSVLVYDPIGTKLDNQGAAPLSDARLGIDPPAPTRVTESFEVARDPVASAGLPAGPVRLFERRADGSLVLLGESRLFEATARVANVDTIAIGSADGVTGSRERRELTIDEENRRLVEEFVITLVNRRAASASVLVREHLYRGQNWTLAYHNAAAAAKEGPQQIALRTEVPARSQLEILYVVVYTWGP